MLVTEPRLLRTEQDIAEAVKEYGLSPDVLKRNCILSPELFAKAIDYGAAQQKYIPLIANYRPNAEQMALHNTNKPIRIGVGGNKSGKTKVCIVDSSFHQLREYPIDWYTGRRYGNVPIYIRHCAESYEIVKDVIIEGYKEHLPEGFIKKWHTNTSGHITGYDNYFHDHIQLMNYDQDAKDYASVPLIDEVYEDEPPAEDIHDENVARTLLKTKSGMTGRVTIAATILTENPWVYDKMLNEANRDIVFYVTLETRKNPAITDDVYKELERKYGDNEDTRNARLFGKPVFLSGIVFKEFNSAKHIKPWFKTREPEFSHYMGCDPHGRKSWYLDWWAVNRQGRKFIVDEAWRDLRTYRDIALMIALKERRITDEEYEKMMRWDDKAVRQVLMERFFGGDISGEGMTIWNRIMDTSGWEHDPQTDRPKADELADYGIIFEQANKSDSGITTLHQWLNPVPEPELLILDNCVEHIFQFQNAMHDDWSSRVSRERNDMREKIRSKRTHYIDLSKYMANFNPQWIRVEESYTRRTNAGEVNPLTGFARPQYVTDYRG